ncbi:MAG: hypothetical protein GTO49_16560 [Anaerolineae bacterium]|nr:hypothetical protein [Anaerolineae bacterium]
MSIRRVYSMVRCKLPGRAVFIGGTVLLVGTWALISFFMLGATEGWLVPWDCVHVSLRPPLGTWARTINDFFEGPPGSFLPALGFVLVSVALFLVATLRTRRRTLLPGALAVTNLAFVLADILLLDVADRLPILRLPERRPAIDVGYYRTWPAFLITAVLVGLLFAVQLRIVIGGKRDGR